MSKQFDVIVIGGGPGGYIAAIRAAQLGFNVACIDEWKNEKGGPALGGTCTNVGCIPSKALLQSSEHYEQAAHHFADHGIEVKGLSLDMAKMIGRKDTVVKQNNDGVQYLFKKNKVTFFHGRGSFAASKDGLYDISKRPATVKESDLVLFKQIQNTFVVLLDHRVIATHHFGQNACVIKARLRGRAAENVMQSIGVLAQFSNDEKASAVSLSPNATGKRLDRLLASHSSVAVRPNPALNRTGRYVSSTC